MRPAIIVLGSMLLLVHCDRGPTGPTPADFHSEYLARFREAEDLEDKGKRPQAIVAYEEARDALESLRARYPGSDYLDPTDLAYLRDHIRELKDEERRGVAATIAADAEPPPPPEPELPGELYWSLRRAMESKLGKETNHKTPFDRAKHIEPRVIDGTQALEIHILANEEFIEGMMYDKIEEDLQEVLKVLMTHREDVERYPMIVLAGFKLVAGKEGYAEKALMIEYRFDQEAFQEIDPKAIEAEDFDLRDVATKVIEP